MCINYESIIKSEEIGEAAEKAWVVSIERSVSASAAISCIVTWVGSAEGVEAEWVILVVSLLVSRLVSALSLFSTHFLIELFNALFEILRNLWDLLDCCDVFLVFIFGFLLLADFFDPFLCALDLLFWIKSDLFDLSLNNVIDKFRQFLQHFFDLHVFLLRLLNLLMESFNLLIDFV